MSLLPPTFINCKSIEEWKLQNPTVTHFIYKPYNGRKGKGIFVLRREDLVPKPGFIIQPLIQPFLLDCSGKICDHPSSRPSSLATRNTEALKFKFDFRFYVAITLVRNPG